MSEPSPHLDLDALADTLAGEGDGRDHLAACPSCTSRLAELGTAEVSVVAALATLPPPRVPDDLAAKLSAAFAAEPPLSGQDGRAAAVTALPARAAQRRRWLPVAAAGVLLLSGAGLGLVLLAEPGDETASTAAGGVDVVLNSSGTDWSDPAAVADVLPQVLEGEAGAVSLEAAEDQTAVTAESAPEDGAVGGMAMADPLAELRTPEGLAACLTALLPPDEPDARALALDYATYEGQPALAVVLPDPDPELLSVFVVGPGCAQGDEQVLQFIRVARPA